MGKILFLADDITVKNYYNIKPLRDNCVLFNVVDFTNDSALLSTCTEYKNIQTLENEVGLKYFFPSRIEETSSDFELSETEVNLIEYPKWNETYEVSVRITSLFQGDFSETPIEDVLEESSLRNVSENVVESGAINLPLRKNTYIFNIHSKEFAYTTPDSSK